MPQANSKLTWMCNHFLGGQPQDNAAQALVWANTISSGVQVGRGMAIARQQQCQVMIHPKTSSLGHYPWLSLFPPAAGFYPAGPTMGSMPLTGSSMGLYGHLLGNAHAYCHAQTVCSPSPVLQLGWEVVRLFPSHH